MPRRTYTEDDPDYEESQRAPQNNDIRTYLLGDDDDSELPMDSTPPRHYPSRSKRAEQLAQASEIPELSEPMETQISSIGDSQSQDTFRADLENPNNFELDSEIHEHSNPQSDAEPVDDNFEESESEDEGSGNADLTPQMHESRHQRMLNDMAKIPPSATQQGFQPDVIKHAADLGNQYAKLLRHGFLPMTTQAYWNEKARDQKALRNIDLDLWNMTCMRILAAMHNCVLREVIDGNIALAQHDPHPRNDDLREVLDLHHKRGADQPSVYVRVLCNSLGESPTGYQLLHLVENMRDYINRKKGKTYTYRAYLIDLQYEKSTTLADSERGKRLYLTGTGFHAKRGRLRNIQRFCNALEAMVNSLPASQRKKPFHRGIQYVGYSNNANVRGKQHAKYGKTASYLMGLVVATMKFTFEYPNDEITWTMGHYIVFFANSEAESKLAEVLLTCIANSFSHTGGGLNVHDAGINNKSSEDIEDWDDYMKWTMKFTPYNQNLILETERILQARKNHDELARKIAEAKETLRGLAKSWHDIAAHFDGTKAVIEESDPPDPFLVQIYNDLKERFDKLPLPTYKDSSRSNSESEFQPALVPTNGPFPSASTDDPFPLASADDPRSSASRW